MIAEKRTIVVKGTGNVKQSPDVFGVSFKVQGHEMEYADSLVSLNEEVEALRQAVEAAGIERESLKTTSFDISHDTIYNEIKKKHEFNGYIAEHRMKIGTGKNQTGCWLPSSTRCRARNSISTSRFQIQRNLRKECSLKR